MINLKNIAVLLFSLVVPGLAIAQTEVLYNGIHLPEQWPPRYAEPQKAQDMPIPYLEQKPGVIPVNVGRQLFVDSFLIAETNLNRVIHTPRFYEGNPVLGPDKEWEKTTEGGLYAAPFSDGIWYDEIPAIVTQLLFGWTNRRKIRPNGTRCSMSNAVPRIAGGNLF